jgi:hypothetical protein
LPDLLTNTLFIQLCLPINLGGLGIGFSEEISAAAYVTSYLSCMNTLDGIVSPFGLNIQNTLHSNDLQNDILPNICSDFCLSLQKFTNIDANYSTQNILLIYEEHGSSAKSFQNHLSSLFIQSLHHSFINSLSNHQQSSKLAWYTSISNSESGLWLTTIPKTERYIFSPEQFRVSLRYRFYLPQLPSLLRPGLACDCASHPTLDVRGHHLTTGCGRQGYRHRTHDFVAMEITRMLNYAGIWTKREENNCFQTIENPDSQRRPDITVYNAPQLYEQKLVMDLSITNPVPGSSKCSTASNLSVLESLQVGRAANKMFNAKRSSYMDAAAQNNLDFLPFIFETTGYLHPGAKDFLAKIAKYAEEEKKIPWQTLLNYMLRNISIVLQRSQAAAILGRSFHLNGRHTENSLSNHALSYDFVTNLGVYFT